MENKTSIFHGGFFGTRCYFCDKNISRFPVVILNIRNPSEFTEHAHIRCAKKNGLNEMGDVIEV